MSKRSERKSEAQVWDWRVPRRIDGPAAPTRASTALVVGFDRHAASRRALEFAIELGASPTPTRTNTVPLARAERVRVRLADLLIGAAEPDRRDGQRSPAPCTGPVERQNYWVV